MYRSLLVPLDGSHFSEHALPVAAGIARQCRAALSVVQVHTLASAEEETDAAAADAQELHEMQSYLRGVVHRLAGVMHVQARECLLRGEIVESLLQYVQDQKIDLIVMTTHGRNGFARLWLGSITEQLLHRLPIPILLSRPQTCLPIFNSHATFRNILIPLDGSREAEAILEPVLALDRSCETVCTLLRVVAPAAGEHATAEPASEAQSYLDRIAARLREEGVKIQTRIDFHANPAVAILDAVSEGHHDLIALATHGRSGLDRLLLGSVADQAIRKACCPVLTVKTPSAEAPSLEGGFPRVVQSSAGS